jgi:hypothetical protein
LKKLSLHVVKTTIAAGQSEYCDVGITIDPLPNPLVFFSNILKNFKGEVCGSHYKVLNIDRSINIDLLDDSTRKRILKKAYRKLSLIVHPDKHSGSYDSQMAFEFVQEAYDCLSDENCRNAYNTKLMIIEQEERSRRLQTRTIIGKKLMNTVQETHLVISRAANFIHQLGRVIHGFFDKWHVTFLDDQLAIPIGRISLLLTIWFKARNLFVIYGLASLVVLFNNQVLKLVDSETAAI